MGLACKIISTGKLIEWQSDGTEAALRANALSGGFAANDVQILTMSQDEFKAAKAVEPKSNADISASLAAVTQRHLNMKAKERHYGTEQTEPIASACSYAGYTNPYQAEGQAFLSWRGTCWSKVHAIEASALAGQKYKATWANVIPTEAELIAELPVLVLPA